MTEPKNVSLDNSKSCKAIDNSDNSNKSTKEDFLKINQNFVETGIQNSFKTLNSNIYNVLNSSFSNLNSDYEKKLDNSREKHENAVAALNSDINNLKESFSKKTNKLNLNEQEICEKLFKIKKFNTISKIFKIFQTNHQKKKIKRNKFNFIVKICENKKKRNIVTCWRNITHAMAKSRIKLKYSKMYNERRKEIETFHMAEINKCLEILQKIEMDIKKEIDERKALNKLYDMNMAEGAEKFIKETKTINEFNSSSNFCIINIIDVSTPNERSFRHKERSKENSDKK